MVENLCQTHETEPLGGLAGVGEELPAQDAKLLPVLESLSVWIVAGCDEQVVCLVLTVAQALLGDVVHGVDDPAVLPHPVQNLIGASQLATFTHLIGLQI